MFYVSHSNWRNSFHFISFHCISFYIDDGKCFLAHWYIKLNSSHFALCNIFPYFLSYIRPFIASSQCQSHFSVWVNPVRIPEATTGIFRPEFTWCQSCATRKLLRVLCRYPGYDALSNCLLTVKRDTLQNVLDNFPAIISPAKAILSHYLFLIAFHRVLRCRLSCIFFYILRNFYLNS